MVLQLYVSLIMRTLQKITSTASFRIMFSDSDLLFRLPENTILPRLGGDFARQIAILVLAEPDAPGNLPFLSKVLAAARLNLEKDTAFAEIQPGECVSFLPILKDKHATHLLVFGLSPAQLGLAVEMQLYQAQIFYGATFLWADRLSVLEPDKTRKGQLWQALQRIFL